MTNDTEPDPEPHWGEWISLTLLVVMCAGILGMLIWKFWPSHWEKDPENNQVKIMEAMKSFE